MNFVSIILPFFKKREYIEDAISSILSQSYKNFEILIVYDEKDKGNLEFLNSQFGNNEKIRIIVNNNNYGAGVSRNIAINQSKGDFIAFLDADDIWLENKLEYQINYMVDKNIDASHTSYIIIDKTGKHISKRKAKTLNYKNLLSSCDIGLSTVILRKKVLNEYFKFPELKTKEDYVLWLKLAKSGVVFHGIDVIYLKWRKLENSLSSSTFRKLIDGYKVYNKFLKFNFITSFFCLIRLSLNYLIKK